MVNLSDKTIGQPLVSISCITHNHAAFLKQCLDGFLMQKTNFVFEIVIHDDASTDGTKEIIEEYTSRDPEIFFPMYQEENQYSKGIRGIGIRFNFRRCRGKYIALCEGDDYWTDENKLQKQVNFLEANTGHSICWTIFEIKNEANSQNNEEYQKWLELLDGKIPEEVDLNNVFNPYWTLTLTTMFRSSCIENIIPDNFKYFKDNTLYSICLSLGKGFILDSITAVYRRHSEGIYSGAGLFEQRYLSYLNIQEIIENIPACRNKNFIGLRNFLLKESINLAQKNSKEYFQLIRDGLRYLEFKDKFNVILNK